ncbi:MAG: Sugar phosphate isomerase/epimerase [Mucilaginibacter sp.]|nr:Sugar phosphate isomerase/epimerase [Mucilaginibacter sp.]
MNILFFCTRWGSENLSWPDFLLKANDSGYDGIETSLPLDAKEQDHILNAINKSGLKLIGQHWDTVEPEFNKHIEEFEQRLGAMALAKPLFITSHTGKDHYTIDQNIQLLSLAQKISSETGVPIIHETHRGKFSFAAHITKTYLEKLPWLRLTLDISHWFNVAESYLTDQPVAVELALQHTDHIHSRIGYTEGPQVNDPRCDEWRETVDHHLNCWDRVIAIQKAKEKPVFTFTSEFGPFPYMNHEIKTKNPVSDQWDINVYMKDLLKKRYNYLLQP